MHIYRSCRGLTLIIQTSSLPSVIKLQMKTLAVVVLEPVKGTAWADQAAGMLHIQ